MQYRVGYCQFRPELFEIDKNIERLRDLLTPIEADLIVLPELATSGYIINNLEEMARVAENRETGKTLSFFRKLAKEKNTSYVVGFAEEANGKYYNSSFLANPDGSISVYRKTHLFNREKLVFLPGDSGFFVAPAKNGVKVGMMVCFDWIFPESTRTLALRGAQIICHPSNLVLPWCQQAMITRSIENRVFTITANRIGKEINGEVEMTFTGQSQVTTPLGKIINREPEENEAVFVTTIDPEQAEEKMVTDFNHIHSDRRPEMYE